MSQTQQMRIGDAERNQAVDALQTHHQAGRLSLDEFEERMGTALQAKTGGELATLFTDLPEPRFGVVPTNPFEAFGLGGAPFGRPAPATSFVMEPRPMTPPARRNHGIPWWAIAIAVIIGLNVLGTHVGWFLLPAIAIFLLIRTDRKINQSRRH